jgi:hypothetical protein
MSQGLGALSPLCPPSGWHDLAAGDSSDDASAVVDVAAAWSDLAGGSSSENEDETSADGLVRSDLGLLQEECVAATPVADELTALAVDVSMAYEAKQFLPAAAVEDTPGAMPGQQGPPKEENLGPHDGRIVDAAPRSKAELPHEVEHVDEYDGTLKAAGLLMVGPLGSNFVEEQLLVEDPFAVPVSIDSPLVWADYRRRQRRSCGRDVRQGAGGL